MKILVTNDDGIHAQALWTLATELSKVAEVVVAAPDREQSAIGTAVTLHQILRARKVSHQSGIPAYAVEGTPADSVILALTGLFKDEIGLVVSGINNGLNLGDDVLISGTVSAAMQGFLYGLPSMAISTELGTPHVDNAARLTALLAGRVLSKKLPTDIFLNINVPGLPEVKGIRFTRLARGTHTNVAEERNDFKGTYYRLVRSTLDVASGNTDAAALTEGIASITPLHTYLAGKSSPFAHDGFCAELLEELRAGK